MYRIAICDDSPADVLYIRTLVAKWEQEKDVSVTLLNFPSAEAFLFHYEEDKNFDIMLLDIEMDDMNGIDLAKRIREQDSTAQIIFITGYPDFVGEGYEVAALHYLMKPVKQKKLFEVLDRATANLKKAEQTILLQVDGQQLKVTLSSIKYLEAMSHTLCIYTTHGKYETRMPISKVEALLGEDFIKCHRSFIVNLKYVSLMSKTEVTLDSGEKLPLSRSSYKEVNQAFIKYYTGEQK